MLQSVKWGEFRIGDLFESSNGNFDIQKNHINNIGHYVITAGLTDNGILGKTDVKAKIFLKNTITIDMFGNVFYRNFDYKMVTHARVFSVSPLFKITEKQGLFLANSLCFLSKKFGYENMCSWAKIKNTKIQLPICENGAINFSFMEKFIAELEATHLAELEATHLAELEAYLQVTGLKDYKLTDEEKQALKDFENDKIQWQVYRIGELFEKLNVLKAKKSEVRKFQNTEFNIPVVYCKFGDNGIMYWGRKGDFDVFKNVISIVYNGAIATGKVYAQKDETGILAESYFVRLKNKISSHNINLFLTRCLESILYPKYSRDFLATWDNKVENDYIQLPTKNNIPDYDFMQIFIKAIEKLVIKDVVLYSKKKIASTKEVINKNS